jgi:hypothetical protein
MREYLARLGEPVREALSSFRNSMIALVDQHSTREDIVGLMWIAAIALVIVLVWWLLKAHERRTIM